MARLGETTVQVEALQFLRNRYRKSASGGKIYAQTEARTKKKYGGKRADGLIVYRNWFWGTVVVSIEAKSYKTLPALKPKFKPFKLLLNSIWAGFLICILSGGFFAIFKMNELLYQIIIPLNIFLAGAILYAYFTRKNYRNYHVKVIDQLRQYPANEQWLAFSNDSLKALSKNKLAHLKKICKDKRVGILSVQKNGRVKIIISPWRDLKWFGDFIKYYSAETEIRKELFNL